MPHSFILDENTYDKMLDYLFKLSELEVLGLEKDTSFMKEDFWLQDTVVIENIEIRDGESSVYLVFAHHLLPLKFIKRKIKSFSCPKRAALAAQLMRKQAAKDQRGTLVVNPQLINLIFN